MWHIILGLVIVIYALINLVLPNVLSGFTRTYVAQPILWASLAFLAFKVSKHEGLTIWFKKVRKWQFGNSPVHAAILIAALQITLLVFAGVFLGFGKSPYSFSPQGILTNIVFVASTLFGMELSRAYLIRRFAGRGNAILVISLTALLFTLINISPAKFGLLGFSDPAASAEFIGSTCIPSLAENLLASYLAFLGGAFASIAYLGTLQAFEWFSPFLPDLEWPTKALIGTIVPTIGFLTVQHAFYLAQAKPGEVKRRTKRPKKEESLPSWTVVAILSVIILWFSFGFFGVHPAIIGSGSMRPVMDAGDIAIITDVPADSIEQGDIIQFRTERYTVIHRVIELQEGGDSKLFITKGDANDDIDSDPVHPSQVTGKVSFVIPKLGWVGIIVRDIIREFIFNIQKLTFYK